MKICANCGKEFEPSKYAPFAINCSKSCTIEYARKRQVQLGKKREYSRRWREKYTDEKHAMDLDYHNRVAFGGLKYDVLERDNNSCQYCGCDQIDKLIIHHKDQNKQHNEMSNLVTLCRACHARLHHSGSNSPLYINITKTNIEKAINVTGTLEEAADLLGVTRSTLRKKRQMYGLSDISQGRSGMQSKHYINISLEEIESAYASEGTWIKAAEKLGLSDGFLRKRYKELKGLPSVKNKIYKEVTKEQIEEAMTQTKTLQEAANFLGITKKTLLSKRKKYGMPMYDKYRNEV